MFDKDVQAKVDKKIQTILNIQQIIKNICKKVNKSTKKLRMLIF